MTIDDTVMADMIANWQAAGAPALRLTLHHPDPEAKGADRIVENMAAGWVLGGDEGGAMQIRPDGLWAKTKWASDTAALIAEEKVRYLSPEWSRQHEDRRTGAKRGWWIYGAALTNEPFFNSMPRVAASANTGSVSMDKKMICSLLNLDENTPDADVMAAIRVKCSASLVPGGDAKMVAALEQTNKLFAEVVKSNAALASEVAAMKATAAEAATNALTDELVRAGKVTPANKGLVAKFVASVGIDDTRKHFETLPAALPMGTEGHGSAGTGAKLTASSAAEASAKVIELADKFEADDKIDTSAAMAKVAKTHPELWKMAASYQAQLDHRE